MILVYFGVFARKSSLQLEWLQAPPSKITGVPCLVPFPLLPTLNISAILIFPKQWFFKVTPLCQNLQRPPATHKTVQIPEPGIQWSWAAFPRAPASSGTFPNISSLFSNPKGSSYSLRSELSPYTFLFLSTYTYTIPLILEGNFSCPLRARPRLALPTGPLFDGIGLLSFYYVSCVLPLQLASKEPTLHLFRALAHAWKSGYTINICWTDQQTSSVQ